MCQIHVFVAYICCVYVSCVCLCLHMCVLCISQNVSVNTNTAPPNNRSIWIHFQVIRTSSCWIRLGYDTEEYLHEICHLWYEQQLLLGINGPVDDVEDCVSSREDHT